VGKQARLLNDMLSAGGFRRSQSIAYRPACEGCKACISVRVVVDDFKPNASFKRILKHNKDLIGIASQPIPTSEQYSLFARYLDDRHADGGMAEMTVLDYATMVEDTHVNTTLIEYRKRTTDSYITGQGGDLVAVALTDRLTDGLSMVYSFFDTEMCKRSLGTYMILDHINRAREEGLPYLYLGYWVDGSPKMDYKNRFKPQEHLGPDGWKRVE
jgi:arginyl-tRNA--protein-N-Asp/Glu arginylyltransferase